MKERRLFLQIYNKKELILSKIITEKLSYIGRALDADIPLPQIEFLSKKHICVEFTEDGFVIKDNNSSNGLFQNAQKIEQVKFETEALVHVGNIVFEFKALAQAKPSAGDISLDQGSSADNLSMITMERSGAIFENRTERQSQEKKNSLNPEIYKDEKTIAEEAISIEQNSEDLSLEIQNEDAASPAFEALKESLSNKTNATNLTEAPEDDFNFTEQQDLDPNQETKQENEDVFEDDESISRYKKKSIFSNISDLFKKEEDSSSELDDNFSSIGEESKISSLEELEALPEEPKSEEPAYPTQLNEAPEIPHTAQQEWGDDEPTQIKIPDSKPKEPSITLTGASLPNIPQEKPKTSEDFLTEQIKGLQFTDVIEESKVNHNFATSLIQTTAQNTTFATGQIRNTNYTDVHNEQEEAQVKPKNKREKFSDIFPQFSDKLLPMLQRHELYKKITPSNQQLQISYSKKFFVYNSKLIKDGVISHHCLHPSLRKLKPLLSSSIYQKCKIELTPDYKYHLWRDGKYHENGEVLRSFAQADAQDRSFLELQKEDYMWLEIEPFEYLHFRLSPPTRDLKNKPQKWMYKVLEKKNWARITAILLCILTCSILISTSYGNKTKNRSKVNRMWFHSYIE